MLQIIIEQCAEYGFSNIYLSVNYLKEQIIAYFGDGSSFNVSISYLIEDQPLGTAGALQLLPKTISKPILVLNGDVLTRFELQHLLDYHVSHDVEATLCVREHSHTIPFGVVETDGCYLSGLDEKPTYSYYVNAGVYVINPSLLGLIPRSDQTDMPNFLMSALNHGHRIATCPIHEFWLDVGRPETFTEAINQWPTSERLP